MAFYCPPASGRALQGDGQLSVWRRCAGSRAESWSHEHQRKGRARASAALQARAVGTVDAHRAIQLVATGPTAESIARAEAGGIGGI
jgi:hypothetical protein